MTVPVNGLRVQTPSVALTYILHAIAQPLPWPGLATCGQKDQPRSVSFSFQSSVSRISYLAMWLESVMTDLPVLKGHIVLSLLGPCHKNCHFL